MCYQLWLFVSYVQPLWLYTGNRRMYTRINNPLNQFITAQEVDFLIIGSLFSFLYLSSSITEDIANEKFQKNHKLMLHTPTISYPNFSSIHSLQLQKWISWLLAHCSHFYIFLILLLESSEPKILEKITDHCHIHSLYYIQISAQSVQ